ncbi:MAG TPA: hypothetical protein VH372_03775 [Actinospica sp.]|nr:hypothetical protein [Actinospica sp.]
MRISLFAAALAAVAVGTVVAYGWGSSSAQARTMGLAVMLAGTTSLAGVLVRSLLRLRRTTRTRRPGTAAPVVAERIGGPAPVAMPAAAALRDSAAGR